MPMTMSKEAEGKEESGFTLLELLVALTLMALLSVVLLGGLRFGARVWEESERHNEGGNELRLAQMRLRGNIAQAWPYFDVTDPSNPHIRFRGHPNSLAFLAPVPQELAPGGYADVTITAVSTKRKTDLVMRIRPELALVGASIREEKLVSGFSELRLSYFGADAPNLAPVWHDEWHDRRYLPDLVRIEGNFSPEDGRIWPEFIVAPKIGADVSCVFDPLTHFCQGR